jgi:DNA adenine methylase
MTAAVAAAPSPAARPFIKWAGGKTQLLPELLQRMPPKFGRYYEPFIGGGALFWAVQPQNATLGDLNPRLCRTYGIIRDDVEDVIKRLRGHAEMHAKHGADHYYAVRNTPIDAYPSGAIAAWFIYLNKTCFNGLYRENSKGKFNVPVGRYNNPVICDEENLRACSRALAFRASVINASFAVTVQDAKAGDFVYFDPPYAPLTKTADFKSYTKAGFSDDDQRALRDLARTLKARGVHVLLSNSSADIIRELYGEGDFQVEEIDARRAINSKGGDRGAVKELLIR